MESTLIPSRWKIKLPGKCQIDCPMIDAVEQTDFSILYAVRHNEFCLNKNGTWEFEPMPSSRNDEFLQRCRFKSVLEAYNQWKKSYPTPRAQITENKH